MSVFKVQRIRSCVQCGSVLSLKCKGCAAHPDRKPKIVEYYNWPTILEVCPCKCSVRIACQRDGCKGTMWRNKTHNPGGLSRSASLFCSPRCNCLVRAAERDTRVTVPCGWHECRKPVLRSRSQIKTFKAAYCRPDHYFLSMRKSAHDVKVAKIKAIEDTQIGLLHCSGCNDVTEHTTPDTGLATCRACGVKRFARSSALNMSETQTMRNANKALAALEKK